MKIAFLHIGMMKTASTYMQNIWLADESYCLSYKGNLDFVNQLKTAVKRGSFKDVKVDIKADMNYQQGQKFVISNEGLSTSYINDINFQNKIPEFIDYSSQIFGQFAGETPNLLIIVREPLSWIKSIFIQAIKEGGSGSAQKFVDEQYTLLKHSLDLEFIIDSYSRYFSNILILPFEILKDDEDLFWSTISDKFNVPLVTERVEKSNQSFNLKQSFILSQLNQVSSSLLNVLTNSQEYDDRQERDYLLNTYPPTKMWVYRRFIEHASEEELDKMCNSLNIEEIPKDFFDFKINNQLIDLIRRKYFKVLRDNIDLKYFDYYEQKFEEHISKLK
ncbi:hypothetical protein [Orenia marismortui]|uniref:Sulfotransferase domain-containing protein n=1 Tax=Orenia marismortui TaxID=46469 RepID=A0A4R8HPR2_9FIRM|nr:hypothetical protein [Orenia marismortui]TDX58911.1 hypothetical protein C7959_10249 [Orenia marismortui]